MEIAAGLLAMAYGAAEWLGSFISDHWPALFAIWAVFEIGSLQSKIRSLEGSVQSLEFERDERMRHRHEYE